MPRNPHMTLEEARASLEQLRDITLTASGYERAPSRWIAEFHEILESIAPGKSQSVYRLDGLEGVNMQHLHNRVLDILRDFDRLDAT